MSETPQPLRDFVYLDWERVRSIAAQLLQGIPEDASQQRDTAIEGKTVGEASALGILKGQISGDVRFFRSERETRSFHHYIYSLVEAKLLETDRLTLIDSKYDFGRWRQGIFRDGQLIRVVGVVRLMDFAWVSTMMEALPRMMGVAQHAQELSLKRMKQAQVITQKQYDDEKAKQQKAASELRALKIEEISGLVRQLYGNVIRVKIVPNKSHPDKLFVGSGDLVSFNDTAASLSQKYGYEIDADWVTVGQVNISATTEEPTPMPIGNQMEDGFETVALSVNSMIRTASSPRFPAVSFTPISIYRRC